MARPDCILAAMGEIASGLSAALADRYTIERRLGEGGMATVYLAHDTKHDREVAIKVLRPELAATIGPDRFLREIKIAAKLNHPHIIPLYDSGEADGFLFYVMPHVKGQTLRHRIEREKQLPLDETLAIARHLCAALGYAHAQGLVHRDIKPSNILLHEGVAMVTDFGIALAISAAGGDRLTDTGISVGTPEYMSPEQAAGERELDARSDVYSLGCVVYEMLTGEPPYLGSTAQAVIVKQLAEAVPSARRLRGTVPRHIDAALERALAKAAADRFATMSHFSASLESAQASEETTAQSLAVLPFANMSPDPENEYFSDGITEDIIAHLSKIPALKVISRTSVMQFKDRKGMPVQEIAAKLDVTSVLEGSVRRAGNRVRIVAQLIDARADQHLWTDTYDRDLSDIFEIQTDVATKIATALQRELTPAARENLLSIPTKNMDAYGQWLRGRSAFAQGSHRSLEKSIALFRRAIELDPEYAHPYAGIAQACIYLAIGIGPASPREYMRQAREAAERALSLDPTLVDAHTWLACVNGWFDWNWHQAEESLRKALTLNSNSAWARMGYASILAALGRTQESIVQMDQARELDPLSLEVVRLSSFFAYQNKEFERAAQLLNHVLALDPEFVPALALAPLVYADAGRPTEGVGIAQRGIGATGGIPTMRAGLAYAQAKAGQVDQARATISTLEGNWEERPRAAYIVASVHAALGAIDRGIESLFEACEIKEPYLMYLNVAPHYDDFRSHPRFKELQKRMNLLNT